MRESSAEQLQKLIAARTPIIYIKSWEEGRVEDFLRSLVKQGIAKGMVFYRWSCTQGLLSDDRSKSDLQKPLDALDWIINEKDPSVFLFKDLHHYFTNPDPLVIRKIRDIYWSIRGKNKVLVLLSPVLCIPEELGKEIEFVDFSIPGRSQIHLLVDAVLKSRIGDLSKVSEEFREALTNATIGLTFEEARRTLSRALVGVQSLDNSVIDSVFEIRSEIVNREGILEYVRKRTEIDEVGGLENLKEWLKSRSGFFSKEAKDFGLDTPKGLLMTGVSGCGKSIAIQAIASTWNLPMFKLDASKIFGATDRTPEQTLARTLRTIEAVSPCVLWLDEVEKGLSASRDGSGGFVMARIFATFMSWMQDKEAPVFVGATANEVEGLPVEILRKGRFDEIFFVDLPTESERSEIFKIHLKKRKMNTEEFNLVNLSKATNGFNGAEIEECIVSGMFEAFKERRKLQDDDLYRVIGRMIPLSTTMAEKIKAIKRWAQNRTVRASKESPHGHLN